MARQGTVRAVQEVEKPSDCPHIECAVCGFAENFDRGLKRTWVRLSTFVMSPHGGDDGPSYLVCSKPCWKSAVRAMEAELPFPRQRRPRASK